MKSRAANGQQAVFRGGANSGTIPVAARGRKDRTDTVLLDSPQPSSLKVRKGFLGEFGCVSLACVREKNLKFIQKKKPEDFFLRVLRAIRLAR